MLNNLLDYIPDGVFTVDAEWRVTFFNRAAEQITGIKRAEAVGRRCCDVFRASICEASCALRHTLETGTPIINKTVYQPVEQPPVFGGAMTRSDFPVGRRACRFR